MTYEERKQQRLKQHAIQMAFVPKLESELLSEGLATAATLQPSGFIAKMERYPLKAIEIDRKENVRIVGGLGYERLITIKNCN